MNKFKNEMKFKIRRKQPFKIHTIIPIQENANIFKSFNQNYFFMKGS